MRKTTIPFILICAFCVWTLGCNRKESYATSNGQKVVKDKILNKEPDNISNPVNADLDGKVVLLGYDVSAKEMGPGDEVKVTWYWKCNKETGPGWRLFTHGVDDQGKTRVNRDGQGQVRKHFQPEHWKPGMIIKDTQTIKFPDQWNSSALELRVGLWKGHKRMEVKSGPSDRANRVKGPRISTVAVKSVSVEVPRAEVAPVIDGSFESEEAWKGAAKLGKFRHTMNGASAKAATDVRLMWDDQKLYIAMRAEDSHIQSRFTSHDDELWREDAFEVFLDPLGDQKHYYEVQASPNGTVFDSYLPYYRKNRNEWSSEAVVGVIRAGTMNDDADEDSAWAVEIAIPFSSMTNGGGVPPKSGDKWRANFFRVDVTKKEPLYTAWSPPLRGDFHTLEKFGEFVFKGGPAVTQRDTDSAAVQNDTDSLKKDE